MSRVLVGYSCRFGRTRAIADELAQRLRARGHDVEVANARDRRLPPPDAYDAVILGSPGGRLHHARQLLDYVREYRDALERMPTAFFSVGGGLGRLVGDSGWLPHHAANFGRIGPAQAWKLADLVSVEMAPAPVSELSPAYGPI